MNRMDRKVFNRLWGLALAAAFLMLAALGGGGCGGSSGGGDKSTRVNVIGTPESVMKTQILALNNINDDDIDDMERGDLLILCGLADIQNHSEAIAEAFNRGVAIALEHVDSDDIDYLTELLGFDNDFLFDNQDAELYALALREISDDLYPFTYIFSGFDEDENDSDSPMPYSFTIESGDASATCTAIYAGNTLVSYDISYSGMTSGDLPDRWWELQSLETPDDTETDSSDDLDYKTDTDYYTAILEDLVAWVEGLDDLAKESRASQESIMSDTSSATAGLRAAVAEQGTVLPASPRTLTLKYSINEPLPSNRKIVEANQRAVFEARQTLRIYAYHDYEHKKDGFLVESSVTGNPSAGYLDKVYASYGDIVANYTNSARYECALSLKGVNLLESRPNTINTSKEVTESYGWNINGSVTGTMGVEAEAKGQEKKVTAKKSISVTVSGGYNYSKSSKYNLTDSKLFKDTTGDRPAWTFQINKEAEPDYSRGFHSGSIKKKPVDLAKNAHSFESAWEWQVDSSSWGSANEATVTGTLVWRRGALNANGNGFLWIGASNREETVHTATSTVKLARPKYISTSVANLVFESTGVNDKGLSKTLTLLSSGPWKVSSGAGWCKPSTSEGGPTEEAPKALTVDVDANTSGAPRTTTLTFTNNTTGDTSFVLVTQSQYQSASM